KGESIENSELIEEVRGVLKNGPFNTLEMIDALQKLCINHFFQEEIESILKMFHTRMSNSIDHNHGQSLYEVSLNFRILRQEGYYVSADVFASFKQKDGKFKGELAEDVKGLMALYEASQLSIEGDHMIEEAADFSRDALAEKVPFLDQHEATMVNDTLQHPYQRTSPTFMIKKFIKHYTGTTMCELAKLELAKVQSLHQTEVDLISSWWKDLGLAQEFKDARNQPLHWYLWPMASLTDPSLSEQRIELTKPIALVFLIDDIFDIYGTLDELILFTEAVKRWDCNTLEQLPYHLRICVEALYNVTNDISDKIYNKYGFNPMESLKQAWINLCEAFLVEAKWFALGHMPMADDYLKNGMVSSGAHVVIVHLFFLLGGGTSKENARLIDDIKNISSCLAKILRLWDDLGSAKDVNQDGHDGSYVTYYMKENEGCSIQNARDHVMEMITNTWKQLNKECLSPNQFSTTFIEACLNLARMIPLMYNYDENHSLPLMEDYIKSMLFTSIMNVVIHGWSYGRSKYYLVSPIKSGLDQKLYNRLKSYIKRDTIENSELIEEVRCVLKNGPSKTLEMIDSLQKLCINHYFQEEIESILKIFHTRMSNSIDHNHGQSLYEVSLNFRILRQEGYYVSADVFASFKQKDGKFKGELAEDVKGLMALYEASQLSIEGDHMIEEASDFSRDALAEKVPFLDQHEATMVNDTLQHPYQRTSPTFMIKKFIKHYTGTTMCELAKLELAKVQSLHQTEVDLISSWWKDLGLAQEFKDARNQPLHWYLWPMASLTDPSLSEQRIELTKPIALVFLIDDIFDIYGTLDELILFTEAVKGWDCNTLEQLPYHLRICVEALYNVTNDISDKIYNKYGFNPMESLKQAWINLCEAFLVEAKWFALGHMPMADDYLKNGMVSSGAHVVIVHLFFLLGGGTSKENARLIDDIKNISSCLAKILRLWDDLGSAKDVNQDGHDGSYVTYYMKENEGCSIQNARDHVMEMITNTWKQLNKECLSPNQFSTTFIEACLNLARMIPLMYNYDENHSLPLMEDYIKSMF
ncbi:hypothetical protein M8C21_004485, partial [Ambrosia artemisiifolia]